MSRFTQEQLRQRAFDRAAWILRHFWEEKQDIVPRSTGVHTRIFDTIVYDEYITLGKSIKGGGHKEHLVPCSLLRDRAFNMFWEGRDAQKDIDETEKDVAQMLERFLRIAHITPSEAYHLDHVLGLKTTMPDDWDWVAGSVMARLLAADIKLESLE